MAFITLDFETYYKSRQPGKYSLRDLTYEEYIFHPEFQVYMVGIKINAGQTEIVTGPDAVKARILDLFPEGNTHTLLCHNTLFDAAILHWYYGVKPAKYMDTMAMSNALWNHASASLGALAERLWPNDTSRRKGAELVNADGIRYENMSDDMKQALSEYCKQDVDLTFEAFRVMYQWYPAKELDIISMLVRMFAEPSLILDKERCAAYEKKLIEEQEDIIQKSGVPKSILGSDKQFAEYMLKNHGVEIPRVPSPTKKNPHNTKYALSKLDTEFINMRIAHPDLEHIWVARLKAKSNGELNRAGRLLQHVQKDGSIAVPIKYSGAHTHRFSGTNKVNFQNFKRKSELRLSLKAPEGQIVAVADLSNIEARMLAWFAEEVELLEDYKLKRDTYSRFATEIYGYSVNRKLVVKDENGEDKKPFELEGHVGKTAILGLGYGMGPPKFQTTLFTSTPSVSFDLERCTDIVYNKYRKKYRNITNTWKIADRVIRQMADPKLEPFKWKCLVIEHRRIKLPNGLYLNYPGLKMKEEENGDTSFVFWEGSFWKNLYGGLLVENIIQALSRIIMTDAMLEIDVQLREYNGHVVLTVHDEIVAIADKENADEIILMMLTIMRKLPDWCNDGTLVLDAEGGYAQNYSK